MLPNMDIVWLRISAECSQLIECFPASVGFFTALQMVFGLVHVRLHDQPYCDVVSVSYYI